MGFQPSHPKRLQFCGAPSPQGKGGQASLRATVPSWGSPASTVALLHGKIFSQARIHKSKEPHIAFFISHVKIIMNIKNFSPFDQTEKDSRVKCQPRHRSFYWWMREIFFLAFPCITFFQQICQRYWFTKLRIFNSLVFFKLNGEKTPGSCLHHLPGLIKQFKITLLHNMCSIVTNYSSLI